MAWALADLTVISAIRLIDVDSGKNDGNRKTFPSAIVTFLPPPKFLNIYIRFSLNNSDITIAMTDRSPMGQSTDSLSFYDDSGRSPLVEYIPSLSVR